MASVMYSIEIALILVQFLAADASLITGFNNSGSKKNHFIAAKDALSPASSFRLCDLTAASDEGPLYKIYAPLFKMEESIGAEKIKICDDSVTYHRLLLNGTVRQSSADKPCGIPIRAMVDVWQADENGIYSDTSLASADYTCRSRIITGLNGFYSFATKFPGRYRYNFTGPYRVAHVHFRVTAVDEDFNPVGSSLITELHFRPDIFMRPNDGCPFCNSNDPTLIIHLSNPRDYTTSEGTWDILL